MFSQIGERKKSIANLISEADRKSLWSDSDLQIC